MIYSDSAPITFQDALPSAVDVVVIGGGVIGISTAWFLTKAGKKVLVCEKGRVAGEQSSRNWGWIRQQARDPDELPIAIDSVNTWEMLSKEILEETGEDIAFTRQGVLYAATSEDQLAEYEDWLKIAEQHQVDTRMLSGKEVDDLVEGKPSQWQGGMYTPSDGRAEPFKAVPAFAEMLQKKGGLIRENCAVRSVDRKNGQVSGVVTEHGYVKAEAVVCAGGAWSSLFLANLGIRLPQLTVRATVLRTAPAKNIFDGNAALGEVAIRRREDGGYTVASSDANDHFISADSFRYFAKFMPALAASYRFIRLKVDGETVARMLPTRSWQDDEVTPFEKTRVLNPDPSPLALKKMRDGLRKRTPALAELPFAEAWAGMIDVTPDVVPVMDEATPGLFIATGFSGHGFGFGPGAGKVMANMILGKQPEHDLTRFRFTRFSDGSPMRPGPGL